MPTSHFIAISLYPQHLAQLFIDLYSLLHKSDSVIFQNPNTVHITIYYLPSQINYQLVQNILPTIQTPIYLSSSNYFQKQNTDFICYLTSENLGLLKSYFDKLSMKLPNEVPENKLKFIPHVTLFRIINPSKFAPYKKQVNRIIQTHLQKISKINLSQSPQTDLYAVSSAFQPELQIRLS